MLVLKQLTEQLQALTELLQQLNSEQYIYRSKYLADASIGAHTRHIIELLQCAVNGYTAGCIDYVNRARDLSLETDIQKAMHSIATLMTVAELEDKSIRLFCEDDTIITTTYYRELVYNVEHIIHHLALIKVSLIEMQLPFVNDHFGMAYSTIEYKKQLQQT